MKKLSDDIKKALNALAFQDAGEFLPMQGKLEMLGIGQSPSTRRKPTTGKSDTLSMKRPKPQKKLALLFDGNLVTATLEYAIDACKRQQKPTKIDLLIHSNPSDDQISAIEQRIKSAGISLKRIYLNQDVFIKSVSYLRQQSSLLSIVAPTDDALIHKIVEEFLPDSGERLYLPVVLVGAGIVTDIRRQSAA